MLDFTGKVVLVTGGGEGIGRAACRLFADARARLVVIERIADRADALRAELNGRDAGHIVLIGDVTRRPMSRN